jgi:hypothetical protein
MDYNLLFFNFFCWKCINNTAIFEARYYCSFDLILTTGKYTISNVKNKFSETIPTEIFQSNMYYKSEENTIYK